MVTIKRGEWRTFEPPIPVAVVASLNRQLMSMSSTTEKNSVTIISLGGGRYQVSEVDANGKRLCVIVSDHAKIDDDHRLVTGCELHEGEQEEMETHLIGILLNRMLNKAWPADT